jgi:hypothetical protein
VPVVVAAIAATMTSWLVRGLPRQFMVMWENSRCPVWGEIRPGRGARQLARAKRWPMGLRPSGLACGGELHGVAEFF